MEILRTVWDFLSIPSVGSLIGILGVLFAIYSLFITRAVLKISSHLEYKSLIGSFHSALPQNINITYDNNPVEKVSSSVFVIWNSGNKVIDGERLNTIDPLRIEASDDTHILRYNIQKVNNKTNNIKIVPHHHSSNTLFISFDFLNKKDGLRVEVLHTGSIESLCVKGTLKGIKPLNKENKFISNKAFDFIFKNMNILKSVRKYVIFGCLFGLFCIFIYSFINPNFFAQSRPRTGSFNIWTFRATLFVYFMLPTYLFYKTRPPYPSKLRAENNDVDS